MDGDRSKWLIHLRQRMFIVRMKTLRDGLVRYAEIIFQPDEGYVECLDMMCRNIKPLFSNYFILNMDLISVRILDKVFGHHSL